MFETPHHTPYAFNLHVQDVGHTLVLGATGSGKSFLLNFLVTHAQKYDPLTVVLDLGHSYRKLATLLGGQLPRTRPPAARRHDQPVRARADAGAPALPARVRPRAAGGRRRLSAERPRGPGDLRGGREPVRARPQPAAALHAGQPAAARAGRRGCTSGSARAATRASSTTSRTR